MNNNHFDTLSQAINSLSEEGYNEGFKAEESQIIGIFFKKRFFPEELKIVKIYRFEGMTNPQDETIVFAIQASDGTKGTLVMSYSAEHNQNVELIKKIPKESK